MLDPVLRDKALALMKAGRASDPNWYAPDLTLKRIWILVTCYRFVKKCSRVTKSRPRPSRMNSRVL